MIQDTTLRMIVRVVDEATQPLDDVKKRLDEVSTGLDDTKKSAGDALPQISKGADDAGDSFDDMGESAKKAAFHVGPGMIEAIAAAGFALVALVKYLSDVAEEHRRVADLATSLNLPYDEVKRYSAAWEEVAVQLNEAARGYTRLKEAQAAAFAAVGLDPGNKRQTKDTTASIALGKGTELEKIDALRRLFGVDDKKAIEIIRAENEQFFASLNAAKLGISGDAAKRILSGDTAGVTPQVLQSLKDFRTPEGVGFGQLDVSRLTQRLPTPNAVEDQTKGLKEVERVISDIQRDITKAQEEADRAQTAASKKSAAERLARQREEYDDYVENLQLGAKIVEDEQKATTKAVEDGDKEIAKSSTDTWKQINEQTAAQLKQLQFPVNEFVEDWKDAMKDMIVYGDFSFKRLVAQIIVSMTSRELFKAIDNIGDALDDAIDVGKGGGGFLGGVKSFIGSLFGGKAGGGRAEGLTRVGEDGPEWAYFGAGGRVMNSRQMAFAGAGAGQQAAPTIINHNTYSISGVETQQVIAYVENTQRVAAKENIKMLERNGLGRMR